MSTRRLTDVPDLERARSLAEEHLAEPDPERWLHVRAVARQAQEVTARLATPDVDALIAAAWLHDLGYAPEVAQTGFHALDGARYLRRLGFDDRVVALVAHHSCALLEAEERGLEEDLASEFDREESATADALWYCDMTTGPRGERMTVEQRLAEIRSRYGPDDVVTRFIDRAEEEIVAAVRRTEQRLHAAEVAG